MPTYVLLTRLATDALNQPKDLDELGQRVTARLKEECPAVKWVLTYALLGPYDYLDIFEAPDNETATRVALIVRSFGHATTEIWPAIPWDRFRHMILGAEQHSLPAPPEEDTSLVDVASQESFPASDSPAWGSEPSTT